MAQASKDSSISGYFNEIEEETHSDSFTDIELISMSGHCVLLRGKRHGQWWLLKGLSPEVARSSLYNRIFEKEFKIQVGLSHPGIARAFQTVSLIGEWAGQYIVMEWIDGMALSLWLKQSHSLSQKLHILTQLLDAVAYMHSCGIVHRDLKPDNLMISHNGSYLKIIDFGLSDSDSFSELKQPAGTIGFISPEQLTIPKADIRNDIFSIGEIMRQMQLGRSYNAVIRRCRADSSKRYENISALKMALDKSATRLRTPYILLAIILILIAIPLGTAIYKAFNLSDKEFTDIEIAPDSIQVAGKSSRDSVTITLTESSPGETMRIQEVISSHRASDNENAKPFAPSSKCREALQKTLDIFEYEGRIIDAELDTLPHPKSIDLSRPDKAWKDFYYKLKPGLTDDEYDMIYYTLERHSATRKSMWRQKIDAIKSNAKSNE